MGSSIPRAPITRPAQAEPIYESDRDRRIESLTAASTYDAQRIRDIEGKSEASFLLFVLLVVSVAILTGWWGIHFQDLQSRVMRLEELQGIDAVGRRR